MQRCLNTLSPFLELVCMSRHLALPVPVLQLGAGWVAPHQPEETSGGSAQSRGAHSVPAPGPGLAASEWGFIV